MLIELEIKPGDLVLLRNDREPRKVLDVRRYVGKNGENEVVLKLQGLTVWVPAQNVIKKVKS